VAKGLGISPSAISGILSGSTESPSNQTILLLELRFGIRQEWIETGEGPMELTEEEVSEGREFNTFGERLTYALTCFGDIDPVHKIWDQVYTEKEVWDGILNDTIEPDHNFLRRLKNYYGDSNFAWIYTGEGDPIPPPGTLVFPSNPYINVENTSKALEKAIKSLENFDEHFIRLERENVILKAKLKLAEKELEYLSLLPDVDSHSPVDNGNGDELLQTKSIPLYDVKAAAGKGTLVMDENIRGYLEVTNAFLSQELGISADRLAAVTVQGDSMEDTYHDGDIVIIEVLENNETRRPGVYVFSRDGEILVKRLKWRGETLTIISDNPEYPSVKILPTEKDIRLVGRVVWKWKSLE